MLNNVIECAREAGSIALQYFRQDGGIGVENKLNDSDIVTVADKASETCIKQYIYGAENEAYKLGVCENETDCFLCQRVMIDLY